MMTQPSGVFAASWHLSVLHAHSSIRCTCMQSRPSKRIVGQSFLCGKLWVRCERPGMLATSSAVGTMSEACGISCVKALIEIVLLFVSGVIVRPEMAKTFLGCPIP